MMMALSQFGKKERTLLFIFFASCIAVSIFYQSRAFAVANIVSVVLLVEANNRGIGNKRYLLIKILAAALILSAMVFCIKVDSSAGRMLIYKISFGMWKEHWLGGMGFGNFKKAYMLYQAQYFSAGQYTVKELLLADNTYLAFNDYWQWIIEMGLTGLALLILLIFGLLFYIRLLLAKYPNHWIVFIGVHAIVVTSIAALLTHVFQHIGFQLVFLGGLFILVLFDNHAKAKVIVSVFLIIILSICAYDYGFYLLHYGDFKKAEKARQLKQVGDNAEAQILYDNLYPKLKPDINFLNQYANFYRDADEPRKALPVFQRIFDDAPNSLTALHVAELQDETGNKKMAEKYYNLAINMVPNRFATRYQLLLFHAKNGNYAEASKIADNIVRLPVKIKSLQVDIIKSEARKYILYRIYNK